MSRRSKLDVDSIGWYEQIKDSVSISGSLTVDGSTKVNSNSLVNQKAIQFDGLTPFDEVTISDATTDTSFSSGGGTDKAFTISMWVNLEEIDYDGTNGKHAGALYSRRSTSPNLAEIYIGVGSGRFTFILYADPDENGTGTFSTSNNILVQQSSGNNRFFHAENTWFHLCVTYDGSKALTGLRFYKNSHPVGNAEVYEGGGNSTTNSDLNVPDLVWFTTRTSTNYSGLPQTSIPTTLGGIDVNDSTSTALAGKLADVCRFNRVLTHTEVQELYNGGKVKNMEEHSAYSDLVHWWKMGDHIDTTGQDGIKDYVGGYHGTLGGDASIVSETTLGSDVSSTIHFNDSGSIGIGTINPGTELDVIGNSKFLGDVDIDGSLSFEDYVLTELSIPGLDLQTDTNAFRFNCPYGLTVESLDLYLDQHTTSGNVTVTVTNTTDTNQMINLSIPTTDLSATTSTVSSASCDAGDIITFAITATPANAQGLRANLKFRRNL